MMMKLCLVDACCFVLTSEVVQQMSQIQLFKGCVKSWIPICDMFSCLWPPYGIKPPSSYACRSWKIECWFGADAITCDSRLSHMGKCRYIHVVSAEFSNFTKKKLDNFRESHVAMDQSPIKTSMIFSFKAHLVGG